MLFWSEQDVPLEKHIHVPRFQLQLDSQNCDHVFFLKFADFRESDYPIRIQRTAVPRYNGP